VELEKKRMRTSKKEEGRTQGSNQLVVAEACSHCEKGKNLTIWRGNATKKRIKKKQPRKISSPKKARLPPRELKES